MRVEILTPTGTVVRDVATFQVSQGVLCLFVANPDAGRAGHVRYIPPHLPDVYYAPGQWSRISRLDGAPRIENDDDPL